MIFLKEFNCDCFCYSNKYSLLLNGLNLKNAAQIMLIGSFFWDVLGISS